MNSPLLIESTIKHLSSSQPLQSAGGAYDGHDWALLELSTDNFGVNEIRDPSNEMNRIIIDGYRSIMLEDAPLYVITKRRILNARSIAGSGTSINFYGSEVSQKVWTIQLTKPLGK